jgi:hypothetical protein
MARVRSSACSIDEAEREVVARAEKEVDARVENIAEVTGRGDATAYALVHEDSGSSDDGSDEATDAHAPDDESSRMYYFGESTITLSCCPMTWPDCLNFSRQLASSEVFQRLMP